VSPPLLDISTSPTISPISTLVAMYHPRASCRRRYHSPHPYLYHTV
jgi:hypothetical protein